MNGMGGRQKVADLQPGDVGSLEWQLQIAQEVNCRLSDAVKSYQQVIKKILTKEQLSVGEQEFCDQLMTK